jgi:hypothetical protein
MHAYGKVLLMFLLAASATAQQGVGVRAGMINYAEGFFSVDDKLLQFPGARFREIPEGSSLRTGSGWVEVQLGPTAYLWLGENGTLQMEDSDLESIQILVERGSVVMDVFGEAKGINLRIRFGNAVIEPQQPGRYRLDSETALLRVYKGKAKINLANKETTIGSGKSAVLSGNLKAAKFDVRKTDALQEKAILRAQLLSRELQEAYLRDNPGASEPKTRQEQGKWEGYDRLQLERLYQDTQERRQTRPAEAGPHPQPWETNPQQQQQPQP